MSDLYTDADVQTAARIWWTNSGHDWDAGIEGEDKPYLLSEFRAVLDAVAPTIAARAKAEAWDEGARAVQSRLATFGSAAAMPGNPYRADEIERTP